MESQAKGAKEPFGSVALVWRKHNDPGGGRGSRDQPPTDHLGEDSPEPEVAECRERGERKVNDRGKLVIAGE